MVYLIQDSNFQINIFSEKLADSMTEFGVSARFLRLGNVFFINLLKKILPSARLRDFFVPYLNMLITMNQVKKIIKTGDVFIIYESANTISKFRDCSVHKLIHKKGGKIISVIPDAWHLSYPILQKGLVARANNSDILAGVTPTLTEALRNEFPKKKISLMEESIDYDAFSFKEQDSDYVPIVLWSGPPVKLVEVEHLDKILQKLGSEYKFKLRVVTGKYRPNLMIKTEWEWIPFIGTSYKDQYKDSSIGFAPYQATPYAHCKGNYKIKTYLAAGCAVVTLDLAYNRVLVGGNKNGIVVSDEAGMVEAFKTLLSNYRFRENCRKNAREFILTNYSIPAIALKYIKTLKDFQII